MTDYTKTVNFTAKDALATGNPAKVAKGTEVDTEFTNIQTAIATKYDSGKIILAADGGVATPGLSYSSDPSTGLYRTGPGVVDFSSTGVQILVLNSTGAKVIDGTVANPSVSFISDQDTGLYHAAANVGAATAGGILSFAWDSLSLRVIDGTSANPGLAFNSDLDTGLYHDTANQIAIALGGSTAGQIAQGSFTATATGLTTAPTGTVKWQRFGNILVLQLPLINGTSNATTFTLTGVPAAITPAASTGMSPEINFLDNAASILAEVQLLSTSVLQFSRSGAINAFTAAGSKGVQLPITVTFLLN